MRKISEVLSIILTLIMIISIIPFSNINSVAANDACSLNGHTFDEWETIQYVTCAQEGINRRTCEICGETEEETIPKKIDHAFEVIESVPTTCTTDGYDIIKCSICGFTDTLEYEKATGHTDSDTDGFCDSCGEYAPATSGKFGDNLTWKFDESTGTLTISGNGYMYDWEQFDMQNSYLSSYATNIIIEEGVQSIGNYAFHNFTSLENIVIPDSVTSIGWGAFQHCSDLVSITIPKGVTTIYPYAFKWCFSLAEINVSQENTKFTSVDGVLYSKDKTSLLRYPSAKTDLSSYTIPDTVTTIFEYAFEGNSYLQNITIPEGMTEILFNAFSGCAGLVSVTIPDSLTTIYDNAFEGCESITDVYYQGTEEQWNEISISDNNEYLTNAQIHYNYSYQSEIKGTCGDNLTWTFDELTGILRISGTGDMDRYYSVNAPWFDFRKDIKQINIAYGVSSISDYAFKYCNNLTSITIPGSVKTIGIYAFISCSKLTNVTIPDGVTTIKRSAFYSCTSLESVAIPNSVTTIGNYAFEDCFKLKSIIIPDGVTKIDDGTFRYCYALESVTIPDSVTTIGWNAFYGCSSLKSITIPDSVTSLSSGAFECCTKLEEIIVDENNQNYISDEDGILFNKDKTILIRYPSGNTRTSYIIPNSVKEIGENAFERCGYLASITIPNGVTTIGVNSFSSCSKIKSIIIPDSVTNIKYQAFYNCTSLESVAIPNSVTTIGNYAFKDCFKLKSIIIPDGVTKIDDGTFSCCYALESVTIPDSVTTIAYKAFYDCSSLTSIIIPSSVTTIETYVFKLCTNLKDVYYLDTEAQWKNISIGTNNECLTNATIHFNHEKFTGIKDDYFYKDGILQKAYQLVEFEGNFYFINDSHKLAKSKTIYLSEKFVEGFTYEDGTPLAVGYYEFDENGKMLILNGPVGDYFYKNNIRQNAYQLVEFEGNYYFINDSHKIAKNKKIYLSEKFIEGFTFADGTPLTVGYYNFDEDGKMIILNGPVGEYFYKNNVRLNAYQLVEFEGDYYFINDSHKLAKNKTLYLSDRFVNGFTYEDGTPLKAGYYTFDENGKMVMLNGPVSDYFYRNNVRLKAYQIVEFEGNYYFINDSHKLAKNTRIYLNQRFVEGTDLEVGYYEFDADGKMIIE